MRTMKEISAMRCASMRKMIFVESVESGVKMLVLGFKKKKSPVKTVLLSIKGTDVKMLSVLVFTWIT